MRAAEVEASKAEKSKSTDPVTSRATPIKTPTIKVIKSTNKKEEREKEREKNK